MFSVWTIFAAGYELDHTVNPSDKDQRKGYIHSRLKTVYGNNPEFREATRVLSVTKKADGVI